MAYRLLDARLLSKQAWFLSNTFQGTAFNNKKGTKSNQTKIALNSDFAAILYS